MDYHWALIQFHIHFVRLIEKRSFSLKTLQKLYLIKDKLKQNMTLLSNIKI